MAHIPWEIKYRPKTFDEYIFQTPKYKQQFEEHVKKGIPPHLFLSGVRGTGKTAIVYLLKTLLDVEDEDFLKLNASDENSVEVIRQKVKKFVRTMPYGEFKLVFLDEADNLSIKAQESLKSMIEDNSDTARFVFACNTPHRVIKEIKSRCHEYTFKTLDKKQMLEQIAKILSSEHIKVKSVDVLDEYVNYAYPDMRKLINSVEQNCIEGELTQLADNAVMESGEQFAVISQMIEDDTVLKHRDYIYENVSDDECMDIYRSLTDYITEIFADDTYKQKQGIIVIADTIYRDYFTVFKQATLESCLIRLSTIANG